MKMNKQDLFDIGEIGIFYQYLALGERIKFNNGLTDLEIRMITDTPYMNVVYKNLSYPEIEEMGYDDMLYVGNILGIIDYLKRQPSTINPNDKCDNMWNQIKCYVAGTVCLNKINSERR